MHLNTIRASLQLPLLQGGSQGRARKYFFTGGGGAGGGLSKVSSSSSTGGGLGISSGFTCASAPEAHSPSTGRAGIAEVQLHGQMTG